MLLQANAEFIHMCESHPVASLLPDKRILSQPGGQLVHSMAGHKGDILSLDLAADAATALSCRVGVYVAPGVFPKSCKTPTKH